LAVVDDVIREPLGGAHRDHHLMANRLKIFLRNALRELVDQPVEQLLEARYQKFRRMGAFLEGRISPGESEIRRPSVPLPLRADVVAAVS
jgi:hypothetical protein